MRITSLLLSLLLAVPLIPAPGPLEAQGIGGLIKKKAAAAVKGKQSRNDQAQSGATNDGAIKSTFDCEVTTDAVSRFLEGLAAEQAQRAALEKLLSGLGTHDQVMACRQSEAISPEVQKLLSQNITSNATTAQLQAAMAQNMVDVEAHLAKKCGTDPAQVDPRRERENARRAGAKAAGMSDDCYDKLKEFALAFCKLSPAQQQAAVQNGIKVPGQGKGEWVFTADEAKALQPRCSELVPAIEATGYTVG